MNFFMILSDMFSLLQFLPESSCSKDEFLDRDYSFLLCAIILEVYVSAALFSSLQLKVVCFVYLHCLCGGP